MKKMRKVFAMLLAFAMVMGMSLTTFAADKKPEATDTAVITVNGVEADVTVTAYKIAKADYNDAGLVGYSKVDSTDNIDIYAPTEAQVAALAQKYRGTTGTPLNYTDSKYTLTADAGLYLILVSDSNATVYNPMVVSLAYKTEGDNISGSWNELQPGTITAASNFKFDGVDVYAKSKLVGLTKEITTEGKKSAYADDAAYGDTATFEITTMTPDYSDEYTNVTFTITDEMDACLDLNADSVVVTADGATADDYTVTKSAHGFVVTFDSEWVLDNPAKNVVITYSAVLNNTAKLGEANLNTATLEFTNEPSVTTTATAATKHYTFKTNGEIIKWDENDEPLAGATFTLTNKATGKVYTSVSADETGLIVFEGLDEGTYTLVETAAPDGYSINNTKYDVVVSAVYDTDGKNLVSYDVTIDGMQSVEIPNTPISSLPSTGGIGTAVFTIGGCAIMIAAAYFFFVSRKKEA